MDTPEGSLLITVEERGVCVFAWDGIAKSEIQDVLKVVQEFVGSGRPNLFTKDGEKTGRKITVQFLHTKATPNQVKGSGELNV